MTTGTHLSEKSPEKTTIGRLTSLLDRHRASLEAALPAGVNIDACCKKAIFAVRANPALASCNPGSLFYAIAEAMSNGLEIGGLRAEAYLVPYGDDVTMIPGYKGFISLVRRTETLESVSLELVHEGDEFAFNLGDDPWIRHQPGDSVDRDSKPVTHVYAVFRFKGGAIQRNVWSAARINAHRDQYSEAYRRAERYIADCETRKKAIDERKLSPWHKAWGAMAKKTVVRDMIGRGLLPMRESYIELINRERMLDEQQVLPTVNNDMLAAMNEFGKLPAPEDEQEEVVDDMPTLIEGDTSSDDAPPTVTSTGPVERADVKLLARLAVELEKAKNLGNVTAIREAFMALATDEELQFEIDDMCKRREAQIREARSAKK
jgi:recombination protein RecT